MPTIMGLKLAGRVIPVRSQYAVVLAHCGSFDEAEAESRVLSERHPIAVEPNSSICEHPRPG